MAILLMLLLIKRTSITELDGTSNVLKYHAKISCQCYKILYKLDKYDLQIGLKPQKLGNDEKATRLSIKYLQAFGWIYMGLAR